MADTTIQARCGRTDPHGAHSTAPHTVIGALGASTAAFCGGNQNIVTAQGAPTDSFTASLALLDDATLARMTANAWREAARSIAEARREPDATVRRMLAASAAEANAYWQTLADETRRRMHAVGIIPAVIR